MGTTSSINPGVANLLQTLSAVDAPVASSPAVVAALEKAPASDIVRLSEAATQLQNVSSLFGNAASTNPFTAGTNNNDFANLESVLTGSPTATTQASSELQNVDSLLGIPDSLTSSATSSNLESLLAGTSSSGASAAALQAITNSALSASPASSGSSTGASSATPASSTSLASQLASYEASQQSANIQSLFGTGSSSSSLNVLG